MGFFHDNYTCMYSYYNKWHLGEETRIHGHNEKKKPTTFVKCSTHQGKIFVECSRFPTVYIYIYIMRFSFGMA